ncbi:esterase/lipase [Penicillium malachiteum]|nr:esterase/lipase [Penicillium malachiteum]
MASTPLKAAPLDPNLAEVHAMFPKTEISTPEELEIRRQREDWKLEDVLRGKEHIIQHEEIDLEGPAGPLKTSIFRPQPNFEPKRKVPASRIPGILNIHGGGHVSGNRFFGIFGPLTWIEEFGATIISAEYRLAPEHPQPAQLDDTYAVLEQISAGAEEFGFNKDYLILLGGSAGGNLAAGVALLARDRAGPKIRAQCLIYPWLDDNTTTVSMMQYGHMGPWSRSNAIDACNYAFGVNREHANMYTVPAHAEDLSDLPSTWLDVGEADVFRDENVEFASKLMKAGVQTELHVWPGCWHGFSAFVPDAPFSKRSHELRLEWVERILLA